MKTFSEFLDEKEMRTGLFPVDHEVKLQVKSSSLFLEYLRRVSEEDGRTMKWYINKAIEMYIQTLGDR